MSGPEHEPEIDEMRAKAEARFEEIGFVSIYVEDKPGKVYKPHSHHEVRLFGLGGSMMITIEKTIIQMVRGTEVHIAEGEEHKAKVGKDGAKYLFARPKDVEPFTSEP